MNPPQLLAIGHVTWDVLPDDLEAKEPGGAVAFAAITAARHGVQPAIVTSSADDYPAIDVIEAPDRFVRVPSPWTSTFENRYDSKGDRVQVLHQRARDIAIDHIPAAWLNPDTLFVGPLTQELPVDCLRWFRPRVSCVVPQGWLRAWNEPLPSVVEVSTSPPDGMSSEWDICVISESEIDVQSLDDWRSAARTLVVTKGSEGADLFTDLQSSPLPIPASTNEVEGAGIDTTGAGDVFAAAMLIRYAETGDTQESAIYASTCAALSTRTPSWSAVEKPGSKMLQSSTS